jgi:hypothetical protein
LEIKRELGHVELHCSGEGFFTFVKKECRRIGGAEHTNGVNLSHQADANSWICLMIFYRLFTSRGQQFLRVLSTSS